MDVNKISLPVSWTYPLSMDGKCSAFVDVSEKTVAELHPLNQLAFQCTSRLDCGSIHI